MEYFKKLLKKSGWVSIIESLVFAILGIVLVWKPAGLVTAISYVTGSIFIAVGVKPLRLTKFLSRVSSFENLVLVVIIDNMLSPFFALFRMPPLFTSRPIQRCAFVTIFS